jgi:serine/threonine protein kinase
MAPEMVIMLTQSSREKVGYSNAVDWWSLGVTMFKLLTGYRPFSEENFTSFMDMAPTLRAKANMGASPEYAILFQQIPFPRAMSDNAVDIISRLLDVNEKTRLGSGPRGVAEIKQHPFFEDFQWELLEQKHVEPPYKPTVKSSAMSDPHRYPTFEAMLADIGKTTWLTDIPEAEDQKYFAAW